jgi:hypothetical protein
MAYEEDPVMLVAREGAADGDTPHGWVDEALAFARTLPPKRHKRRGRRGCV